MTSDHLGGPTDEYHDPTAEEERGEASASAEVDSPADLDLLDADLTRTAQSRADDFTENALETQRLRKRSGLDAFNPSEGGPWGPPGKDGKTSERRLATLWERQSIHLATLMQTSKASFYLDDEIVETDLSVDPLGMPRFEIAEKLVQIYMESVHNSFPFLPKKAFLKRFYHYMSYRSPREIPQIIMPRCSAAIHLLWTGSGKRP
ncbi:hypothetical protein EJ07DRAFT_150533 [Lizonia empirigonia]|nr:hypothetical protein EJ07DRAFT_150533 [Lizonia empirigonia]